MKTHKRRIIKNGHRFPTWYDLVMAQAKAGTAKPISTIKTNKQDNDQ